MQRQAQLSGNIDSPFVGILSIYHPKKGHSRNQQQPKQLGYLRVVSLGFTLSLYFSGHMGSEPEVELDDERRWAI